MPSTRHHLDVGWDAGKAADTVLAVTATAQMVLIPVLDPGDAVGDDADAEQGPSSKPDVACSHHKAQTEGA
ncbi:hypothetical protein E6O75_ATG08272 [Venturia nashicola]|uniref:Uncharacterized protein n=1 Tax=Venturia nashicola TaxID=86259 RepID=A0A4Z1NP82_9PEZI|nr:hypothetical protein E6O75_ATG08272 [Venturia nashicola]